MLGWICNGFELLAWAILLYHLLICEYSDTPPLCYCFEGVYCELLSLPSDPTTLFIFFCVFQFVFVYAVFTSFNSIILSREKPSWVPKTLGVLVVSFKRYTTILAGQSKQRVTISYLDCTSMLCSMLCCWCIYFFFRGSPYSFATTTHT